MATVRFHTEGVEAELYRRLMDGKDEAGLSVPDYIKQILKEYFDGRDRREEQSGWLEQFQKETVGAVEQAVRKCIRECNVNTVGADATPIADTETVDSEETGLPAQSEEMPEGALDFLGGME